VKKQIERIDNEPLPYTALRFISTLIIIGGWIIIIGGWAFILFWATVMNSTFQQVEGVDGSFLVQKIPPFLLVVAGFINTLIGILVIGAGQIYAVILDIRDDMNATMQYVRHGLKRIQ
jgi:hypothetical protein